ncbi:sigma-54-dependent transcriptional regulator [Nitrosococcus oceani]|uniref:Two component, sigma54 specific, transcriptional regulator, Fis family n=3 Tax=Nitrosococcus oceani TaxID=1229 RepID=Q3JAP9_NITOC|nr:sigma-54 dependent transcriptional regulator [Nitrosococcus oceani]ABA58097.1 two component, sigma54 specific, transcriptional regulator, Fis family [Nitrosococcus oceani ATCC 19707]KFI19427.1 Fis family transcriptional regulator [Nitrosococcus oceani C-27]KFI22756.1 Fis family transcriptional regulator [Nitrosococcus oceani]GEM21267.1 sigma-54-dependent Fis family transcriptional regulator [Nitrosococcus oceani]
MRATLLIIEDEILLGTELSRHYQSGGWEVEWATTLSQARSILLEQHFDPLLVLSDMSLPDGNALDLIEAVQGQHPHAEWLLLTGYGSVPDSVRALRLGAYDFLEKPCELEHLDLVIASAARSARAQRRLFYQVQQHHRQYSPQAFVGRSQSAQEVRKLLAKLTEVPFSALIIGGETGTGKGLAARILHYGGERAQHPMVELNCAALPRELLESELFGHEAGAFTGAKARHPGLIEQANGGTLFLDEIGEMPLDLQAKLLKTIEDRWVRRLGGSKEIPVDIQILAASNRDLEEMAKHGDFRSDLYHRLSVFRLNLPALREIKEDLEELVPLFVAEFNAEAGRQVKIIPERVWTRLHAHDWPGNVRELRNVVERCVLFSEDAVFPEQWLQLPGQANSPVGSSPAASPDQVFLPLDGSMVLEEMDRYIIETVLRRNDYNIAAAARALGTTRETLRYRIQKHGLKSSKLSSSRG